jgi:ketosteroid isomerase-like protein
MATLQRDGGAALLDFADEEIHLLRSNSLPAVGRAAAKIALTSDHAKTNRVDAGGGMSAGGDLAYRYGSYESEGGPGHERGNYLSLWRRDGRGNWKILIDVQKLEEK